MFDQMQVAEKHMKPWTVMASFTMQASFVGGLVLASVVQIQTLDLRDLVTVPPLVAPTRPPHVKVVATGHAGSTPRLAILSESKVFTAPVRIPPRVADIRDLDEAPPGYAPSGPYVPGALECADCPVSSALPVVGSLPAPPPPQAKPAAGHVVPASPPLRIGGNVLAGKLIHKVIPAYPPLAKAARISGVVKLQGIVSREGRVTNLQVLSGHPLLVPAAVDAVRQWLYQPTMLNGEPVEVTAPIDVNFSLSN